MIRQNLQSARSAKAVHPTLYDPQFLFDLPFGIFFFFAQFLQLVLQTTSCIGEIPPHPVKIICRLMNPLG